MGDKLKENWIVILFTAFISSAISISVASAAVKWGEIDNAVSESEFVIFKKSEEERNQEIKEETIEYVNSSFNNHEAKEQIIFNNLRSDIGSVKELVGEILDGQKDLIEMSIKRIDRLEDKVYKTD